MKKLLLVAAIGVAGLVSAKAIDNQNGFDMGSSFIDLNTCTVVISGCCEGSGTTVTSSATSPNGDCNAAATVANQQWNTDCMAATIRKVIHELQVAPENP